ncbi:MULTISPECIES: hypothetical protein, partial [unclassified Microcoleus]|uniref:hypothetical protein n=1 Tax=unclassified Microcoleus TaxID=2642155 RepID=UPI0025D79553
KPQMIAEQLFEVLRILNSFEIKSDRISAECGLYHSEEHALRLVPQRVNFLVEQALRPVP